MSNRVPSAAVPLPHLPRSEIPMNTTARKHDFRSNLIRIESVLREMSAATPYNGWYGDDFQGASRHPWPFPRPVGLGVPHDAPFAQARRQGDRPQATEQDLLPDIECGPRGDHDRRRPAAEARARLV